MLGHNLAIFSLTAFTDTSSVSSRWPFSVKNNTDISYDISDLASLNLSSREISFVPTPITF